MENHSHHGYGLFQKALNILENLVRAATTGLARRLGKPIIVGIYIAPVCYSGSHFNPSMLMSESLVWIQARL
jgi:hypothetical protein